MVAIQYIVVRGAEVREGWWFDLSTIPPAQLGSHLPGITFGPTNAWEQRADGAWAQVYRPVKGD